MSPSQNLHDLSLLLGVMLPGAPDEQLEAVAERIVRRAAQTIGASSGLLYVVELDGAVRVAPRARAEALDPALASGRLPSALAAPLARLAAGGPRAEVERDAPLSAVPDRRYAERLTVVVPELAVLELASAEAGVLDDHVASVLATLVPWLAQQLTVERRRTEADAQLARLDDELHALRAAFEATPGAAWCADANGQVAFANDAGRGMLAGIRALDAWRRRALAPPTLRRVDATLAAAREARRPSVVLRYRVGSGPELEEHVRFVYAPDGAVVRTSSVVHEVESTAEQRIEQLRVHQAAVARADTLRAETEKTSRAKMEFLNLLSHELRAPLFPIIALSDLLVRSREGLAAAETEEQLRVINAAGQQMLGLVTDLLDISRLDSGRVRPSLGPISLDHFVESLRAKNATSAPRLEIQVRPGSPTRIYTDRNAVDRVATALLAYATEHLDARHVALELGVDGAMLELSLVAEAPPPTEAPRTPSDVFEPFWERASERGGRGQGLALTLVRRFAVAFGGAADASFDDAHRRFRVRLPAVPASTTVPAELLGERALVSSPDLATSVAIALELLACGADVRTVTQVDETEALLASLRPSVLFLDGRLPGLRSVEATVSASPAPPAVVAVARDGVAIPMTGQLAQAVIELPSHQANVAPLARSLVERRGRPSTPR
jgi:signal transduction histidine kinase